MIKKIITQPSTWPAWINLNDYKSILCLDGDLPDKSFFQSHLPLIAADGAANNLLEMEVQPDLVMGDLDSISTTVKNKCHCLYYPDQNFSDYEKILIYLGDNQLLPAIVLGVNGGNLDHILNNINIFLFSDCLLYAPPIVGYVLKENENKLFALPVDTKLSIMGIPSACVTTRGLKWELRKNELAFPGKSSCFNRSVIETIHVKVEKGKALILIYQMFEQ